MYTHTISFQINQLKEKEEMMMARGCSGLMDGWGFICLVSSGRVGPIFCVPSVTWAPQCLALRPEGGGIDRVDKESKASQVSRCSLTSPPSSLPSAALASPSTFFLLLAPLSLQLPAASSSAISFILPVVPGCLITYIQIYILFLLISIHQCAIYIYSFTSNIQLLNFSSFFCLCYCIHALIHGRHGSHGDPFLYYSTCFLQLLVFSSSFHQTINQSYPVLSSHINPVPCSPFSLSCSQLPLLLSSDLSSGSDRGGRRKTNDRSSHPGFTSQSTTLYIMQLMHPHIQVLCSQVSDATLSS